MQALMTELEKQRAYVRKMQNVNVPCPHCHASVNVNDVLDKVPDDVFTGACPDCGGRVQHQLGLFGGQWFDKVAPPKTDPAAD